MEARDPVVVVLDGGEAELGNELRVSGVDAAHLVHRHLPFLEFGSFLVVCEAPDEQFEADLVLVGEPGGIDGRELHQVILLSGEPVVDGAYGIVGDLVVVALVADRRSEFRLPLEVRLPVIVKECMQRPGAVLRRHRRSRGRLQLSAKRNAGAKSNKDEEERGKSFQQDDSLRVELGK